MNLFTANIKSNPLMRQERVESDIHTALRLGGVGFWQEIAPQRYKDALVREAHAVNCEVYGGAVECPTTLARDSWAVASTGAIIHKMHDGRLGVSPTRYCVETRTHATGGGKAPVAFFSTHFVSGAWASGFRLSKKWRREMWHTHHARMVTLIAAAYDAGYTCIIGMDANRGVLGMPALHPRAVPLVTHGIDGIVMVPGPGLRVRITSPRTTVGLFTDHDPVSVSARLVKA